MFSTDPVVGLVSLAFMMAAFVSWILVIRARESFHVHLYLTTSFGLFGIAFLLQASSTHDWVWWVATTIAFLFMLYYTIRCYFAWYRKWGRP